jgi:hypothetical protein
MSAIFSPVDCLQKAPRQNFLIDAVLSRNLPWRETLRVTA